LNPRTFNTICIIAIIAVGAMATSMVHATHDQQAVELSEAGEDAQEIPSNNAVVLQPFGPGLAMAVLADVGLMTLGLVVLFKDDATGRDRRR